MEHYRRYGRWLKRAAWVLAIYVFFAWLFMLLLAKTHVVEGVRDALLEREELIGDEIEATHGRTRRAGADRGRRARGQRSAGPADGGPS